MLIISYDAIIGYRRGLISKELSLHFEGIYRDRFLLYLLHLYNAIRLGQVELLRGESMLICLDMYGLPWAKF